MAFNWDTKPLYNVIAQITGLDVSRRVDRPRQPSRRVGEWRQRSGSGMAPELEEARALGALLKQGWRPKRTIVYAAWDGEEPGLLGSTEWVEQHDAELQQKAVVYINSDGNGRGFLERQRVAHARALRQRRRAGTSRIPRPSSPSGSGCRRTRIAERLGR